MTHYEILGVSKNATQEEIKEAYKELVKKYHPDVYQGDKTFAEKKTKEINIAYEILSDPESKSEYDEEINPNPSYNYDYTPPKYDTPPSNYNDYRKAYSRSYDYNYQYTDYHRNKTPNSSYYETTPLENKFIKVFDSNKAVIIFLILIIYIAILIFTFCQYYAFKNNKYSGTITNLQKVEETNTVNTNTYTPPSQEDDVYSFPSTYEEFDINDYVSDSELYSLYSQYFYSEYETYEEFKEAISKELYEYYSELY